MTIQFPPAWLAAAVLRARFELGAVVWYLGIIVGAQRVPRGLQRWLERVAVLVIFAGGLWFVVTYFAGVLGGGR